MSMQQREYVAANTAFEKAMMPLFSKNIFQLTKLHLSDATSDNLRKSLTHVICDMGQAGKEQLVLDQLLLAVVPKTMFKACKGM